MAGNDLLTRLADAGEEAIGRLAKLPGGEQLTSAIHTMRERTDDLQKRVRGLEGLEKRVEKLEKQVAALSGSKGAPSRRAASATTRSSASRSRAKTTAKKPAASSPAGDSSAAPTGGDSPG
jgi:hypothetical protein